MCPIYANANMGIIGNQTFWIKSTASTNQALLDLLGKGEPEEGTLIAALKQTSGRGLGTNTWESEDYKNLTFSFVLYPEFLPAENQFELNKVITLGISDFVKNQLPGEKVYIKWPNDIYVGDKKICGMLIQNSLSGGVLNYLIAGIGLNVNQTVFSKEIPNPVSLKLFLNKDLDLKKSLEELCECLNTRYLQLKNNLSEKISRDYQNRLLGWKEWRNYLANDKPLRAKITGVNAFGQLELITSDEKQVVCNLKEIRFLF